MPDFRRYYIPDAIVFITGVTHHRLPYLESSSDLGMFWDTLRRVQDIHPFRLLAYVVLPDHFHWLMRVEDENGDFSKVLHSIKRNYTLNFKKAHGITTALSLWQARFWDHVIRDEDDLKDHCDYIHWNPVKHGYAERPGSWSQSTFLHWMRRGYYEPDWGHRAEPATVRGMDLE